VYRADGFKDQRLLVIPATTVATAIQSPLTSWLTVSDIGYFPKAASHRRRRAAGAPQTIIIACTQGVGFCWLPNKRLTVSAGQVLAIPADTPHEYGASESAPWSIWWAHVTGTSVPDLLNAAGLIEQPVIDVRDVWSIATLIDEALTALERDLSRPGLLHATGALAHAFMLMAAERRLRASASAADAVETIIDYLRLHPTSRLSGGELASRVGLSESYLSALFRQSTGMGILQYQTRRRMSLARQLLDTTDLPINLVAIESGYDDPLYFSRQFRHIQGMSPTDYRAHAKG